MIRSFYAVPAMLCLAAAVVTAQAPAQDRPAGDKPATQQPAAQQPATQKPTTPPSAEPARPAEPSAMASANKVTYTGCVKAGTTPDSWILENAEVAARPGASSPGTVGTSGSKLTLDLSPAATVNLKPHANHKVEVEGTLSPAKGAAQAPPASAPGAATAQAARQQFSVQSLKMVSATCP